MVMKPEPLVAAIEAARAALPGARVLLTSPRGERFSQPMARALAAGPTDLILVAGRYEGVDERVRAYVDGEVSLGDFVLTGGELAALAHRRRGGTPAPRCPGQRRVPGGRELRGGAARVPALHAAPRSFAACRSPRCSRAATTPGSPAGDAGTSCSSPGRGGRISSTVRACRTRTGVCWRWRRRTSESRGLCLRRDGPSAIWPGSPSVGVPESCARAPWITSSRSSSGRTSPTFAPVTPSGCTGRFARARRSGCSRSRAWSSARPRGTTAPPSPCGRCPTGSAWSASFRCTAPVTSASRC